ncbi:helix-turn-helix domain-containing protein [Campylobacter sp. CCS1377]|uniref:Helix-turn-helix domain-containing protein n=1 Tax=Campylobacter sp. CCS1377 TaxID=3158229 RepID=A0AAU7E5C6_9BACT
MVTSQSQKRRVLNILLSKGCVDNFYCIDARITTRLGAYICDFRKAGFIIETVRNKESRNTWYYLKKKPKDFKKAV